MTDNLQEAKVALDEYISALQETRGEDFAHATKHLVGVSIIMDMISNMDGDRDQKRDIAESFAAFSATIISEAYPDVDGPDVTRCCDVALSMLAAKAGEAHG